MAHPFQEVLVRIIVLQVDSILDQVSLREGVSIHEEVDEEVEEDDGKRGRDVRPFFVSCDLKGRRLASSCFNCI